MKASFLIVEEVRTKLPAVTFLGLHPLGSERWLGKKAASPSWAASEDSVYPFQTSFFFSSCFLLQGQKGGTGIWRRGSLSPAPDKHIYWALTLGQYVHC